jgi:endonuclease/exonuclease/phosphatase family metal-dependent hydrolase
MIKEIIAIIILILTIVISYFEDKLENKTGGSYNIKTDVVRSVIETKFIEYVDHKPLVELNRELGKCVDSKSLYDIGIKGQKEGFNVIILKKGTNIYKSFPGFPSEDDIIEYQSKNMPSWLGNKYLILAICKTHWNSIVSYKLVDDIYLIDYFDDHNLKLLLSKINELDIHHQKKEHIKNIVRLATGYNVSPSYQLKKINEHYGWNELWEYTKQIFPISGNHAYCNSRNRGQLNPIGTLHSVHTIDTYLFNNIFSKMDIDGIIREQILSKIDENGVFYHEELLIKGTSLNNKSIIDISDPLHWCNWDKLINKIPDIRNGLPLKYYVGKFLGNTYKPVNDDFKLVNFYIKNNDYIDIKKGKYVMTFNVHGFNSLCQRDKPTHNKVLSLISSIDEIVVFCIQEYSYSEYFEDSLKKMGYNIYRTENGSKAESSKNYKSCILFGTLLHPVKFEEVKYISKNKNTIRNQIICYTNKITFIGAHLEIGSRASNYIICDNECKEAKNVNSNERINQLEQLIDKKNVILMGDFNFTPDDVEYKYLLNKGFSSVCDETMKTTPHNRVDFIFTNINGGILSDDIILKTNISDHLPVLKEMLFYV